jgi:hypothetical protein
MKRRFLLALAIVLALGAMPAWASGPKDYGDVTLSGGFQTGHLDEVWDLTDGDMVISFTYDATGLVDNETSQGQDHAWAELGVRSAQPGSADFNPYWSGYVCTYPEKTADLIAGQHTDVGDVVVWSDGDSLSVKYVVSEDDCVLTETHLAVADSLEGIPQTRKGNPIPGQFAYTMEHDPPVPEYTYVIDLAAWPEGTELYIAAHAAVSCPCRGEETTWGAGYDFPGNNWGTYFTLTADCVWVEGSGVWLATDHDEWQTLNTFDPDPPGAPTLDLDDKLILQRRGGQGEGAYNLPSVPPNPWANHRVWWDRDGVDPWQNDETANTGGIYHVEITLHATSDTSGKAYMTIEGLAQGFETDGNWNTVELTPAGMTFTGDMKHLQVFYGLFGYGAVHSVSFKNITVTQ